MTPILRGGGLRRRLRLARDLGLLGDLARDLDDVPVRAVDVELPVGAVAAAQDLLDSRELLLGAELLRVRREVPHRAPDQPGDGYPVPPSGQEIHDRRGES